MGNAGGGNEEEVLIDSFEAVELFLALPPRELVRFKDAGGGREGLRGRGDMAGNLSSVPVSGVVERVRVLLSSAIPSVTMAGVDKGPSVLLRVDLLLRPLLVGACCSPGSSAISSNSAIPCGFSLHSPRN